MAARSSTARFSNPETGPVAVHGHLHPASAGHLPLDQARHRPVVGGAAEERLVPGVGGVEIGDRHHHQDVLDGHVFAQ